MVDVGGGRGGVVFGSSVLLGGVLWGECRGVQCIEGFPLRGGLYQGRVFVCLQQLFGEGVGIFDDFGVIVRVGIVGFFGAHVDRERGGNHVGGVMSSLFPTATFEAIGTTVGVVTTDPAMLGPAVREVRAQVEALDEAVSRFRPDSELSRANRAAGRALPVSWLLIEAVEEALRAAATTEGLVTPTVGEALVLAGYDRDFRALAADGPPITCKLRQVPGWQRVLVDRRRRTLTIPHGVSVDLGATAKAGCADRAACRAAQTGPGGVLVNLGGDVAMAGPIPDGGWPVRVTDRHDAPAGAAGVTVAIRDGGLATSGTAARRWSRGGQVLHHIVDPRTGAPAVEVWRTATVAGRTCLEANTASTAAIVLGLQAPAWLAERGLHARLVAEDGATVLVGDWPWDTETIPARRWAA